MASSAMLLLLSFPPVCRSTCLSLYVAPFQQTRVATYMTCSSSPSRDDLFVCEK